MDAYLYLALMLTRPQPPKMLYFRVLYVISWNIRCIMEVCNLLILRPWIMYSKYSISFSYLKNILYRYKHISGKPRTAGLMVIRPPCAQPLNFKKYLEWRFSRNILSIQLLNENRTWNEPGMNPESWNKLSRTC